MSPQHTHEETVIKNKQFDFKSLAPKTDVDLTAYEEAFQFALSKVNPLNTKILLALQKQGFVGNFDVDERIGDCYRVYSKKKWNK